MKLNPLGRTGLFVSELCLGTMTFGGGDDGGMWSKIGRLQQEMKSAAANLDFEKAANLRDRLKALRTRELGLSGPGADR